MRFLENLSLYRKLLLSFLIVISLSYVAIFLSVNALNNFNNKITFIVDNDIETLINSLKSRRLIVELRMLEKELFLPANETEKSKNLFNISTAQEELANRFNTISKLSLDPQTSKGMEQFTNNYRAYNLTLKNVMVLIADGKTKEAIVLSRTKGNEEAEAVLISAAYVTTALEKKFKVP